MRYSLEPRYRRYEQGQGFMSFARNIGNKYGKKLFDKSIDVDKSMKKKYGKKVLDNSFTLFGLGFLGLLSPGGGYFHPPCLTFVLDVIMT